jgi:hypothetical protein
MDKKKNIKFPKIKLLNLDEVRRIQWDRKKPPVVNKNLDKHIKSIVNKLVRKDARKEAIKILTASTSETIGQFLYYYYSEIGNVACMIIDSAKDELVKKKKMKQKKSDAFGNSFKK